MTPLRASEPSHRARCAARHAGQAATLWLLTPTAHAHGAALAQAIALEASAMAAGLLLGVAAGVWAARRAGRRWVTLAQIAGLYLLLGAVLTAALLGEADGALMFLVTGAPAGLLLLALAFGLSAWFAGRLRQRS
jgi:hypothetical protein